MLCQRPLRRQLLPAGQAPRENVGADCLIQLDIERRFAFVG